MSMSDELDTKLVAYEDDTHRQVGSTLKLRASDYTVGLVCALPVELAAVQHILDSEHEQSHFSFTDDNQYIFGSIGLHHVVLACLPKGQMGNNMASSVASQLKLHFSSMRFALMIGIGGGVPSEDTDIRLGDVVISSPQSKHNGVIQYDLGKTTSGGVFERTGSLNAPPSALLKVISKLEAKQFRGKSDLGKYLNSFSDLEGNGFAYPGSEKDILFTSTYSHSPHNARSCNQCDSTKIIYREQRNNKTPRLHFGLIASGNQVIKDAITRDALSEMLGNVLCFEMEAAGLVSTFPCLVVRGIADYADSHKNKHFQPWAAASAASCAKEILYELAAADVTQTKSLEEILDVTREMKSQMDQMDKHRDSEERHKLGNWLSNFDDIAEQNDFWLKHRPGTSAWLLSHDEFLVWRSSTNRILFCPGNPGAGKTMIASAVINHLQQNLIAPGEVGICYIFCNYTKHSKQDISWFLSSILKQLIRNLSEIPTNLRDVYLRHSARGTKPTSDEYFSLLLDILELLPQTFIIIDGLDECSNEAGLRLSFLNTIFRLKELGKPNIFATSRYIPEICDAFKDHTCLPIRAVEEDICIYLNSRVHELPYCVMEDISLQTEIQTAIVTAADGIFLLADLHINSLIDKFTVRAIRDALKTFSKGFDGLELAYQSAMSRVDEQTKEASRLAKTVLSWLTYAIEPLTILELQHALAVVEGDEDLDHTNIVRAEDVIRVCEGFVTIDPEMRLVRFVHYTVQEFFQRVRTYWLPNGHEMILNTCLTYLMSAGISSGCKTRQLFNEQRRRYPFIAYAGCQWGRHAQHIDLQNSGALRKVLDNPNTFSRILQSFLRVNLGHWSDGDIGEQVRNEMWTESLRSPWNGFHLAAYFDLEDLTQALLDLNGQGSDAKDDLGRTPLMLAIDRGHGDVSDVLIKSPYISLLSTDDEGRTPLHRAVLTDQLGSLKLMSKRPDFDVNLKDNSGCTALVWAVKLNRERLALFFLSLPELDVNAQNSEMRCALWFAAEKSLLNIVTALLHHPGLNVDLQDDKGSTPLAIAASMGHTQCVSLIMDDGRADVNKRDNFGYSPAIKATLRGHQATVVCLLRYEELDINLTDDSGRTLLMHAARLGLSSTVDLLLSLSKTDASVQDGNGEKASSIAEEQGHAAIGSRLREFET